MFYLSRCRRQGYSVPHPSDEVVHVRVQTTGEVTATQALRDAITGMLSNSAKRRNNIFSMYA